MPCLSTTTKAAIQARITILEAQLVKANTAFDEMLDAGTIETYSLDTGEAKQTTKKRKFEELTKTISYLEAKIDSLNRRLDELKKGGKRKTRKRKRKYKRRKTCKGGKSKKRTQKRGKKRKARKTRRH